MVRKLNIARIDPNVYTLGPGKRLGIWVQGCPFNCKGCIAPEWRSFKKAQIITTLALSNLILNYQIDGITISGGEPFLQALSLSETLKIVKESRPFINVIVFTGFYFEKLTWEAAREFINFIDVLIAGPYIEELDEGKGLRGSVNQEIIFLTDRLRKFEREFYESKRKVQVSITNEHAVLTGIPDSQVVKLLKLI